MQFSFSKALEICKIKQKVNSKCFSKLFILIKMQQFRKAHNNHGKSTMIMVISIDVECFEVLWICHNPHGMIATIINLPLSWLTGRCWSWWQRWSYLGCCGFHNRGKVPQSLWSAKSSISLGICIDSASFTRPNIYTSCTQN